VRTKIIVLLCLLAVLFSLPTFPQNTQSSPAKAASAHQPTASEIATAKAAHQVWVNLGTGIYHKGGRWYGRTKNGKFMTEFEAKKAGYKPSKRA
jgi:hypothetical protein